MTYTLASIKTKSFGPTDCNGSRIIVTDDGALGAKKRRLTVSWDDGLNGPQNHMRAANLWIEKYITLENARLADVGLGFAGEYFWTWDFGTEEGGEK